MKKITWLPASLRGGLQSIQCSRSTSSVFLQCQASRTQRSQLSTTLIKQASIAAPEIAFKGEGDAEGVSEKEKPFNARLVPTSAAYFTAQPIFTDDLLRLQSLLGRYANLPLVQPGEATRYPEKSLAEYRSMVGEAVKASKYSKVVQVLLRLNQIHPSVMPQEVKAALEEYKRDINPYQNQAKPGYVNKETGVALGVGRRKSSSARAWVVDGTGEVLINGKTLTEAFGRIHDRESAIWALKCTNRVDKYNVWARVAGGGTTGQAEALTLAVGKALLSHEPALKPALRRAGCVYRDPRRVERKKPGHRKARKMPAWVKR